MTQLKMSEIILVITETLFVYILGSTNFTSETGGRLSVCRSAYGLGMEAQGPGAM